MSNKSAGPVKTHHEKLIDKAQKAIKEFWPPESNTNLPAETGKQSFEESADKTAKTTQSTQVQTISKVQEDDVSQNEKKAKLTKAKAQNRPINKKSKR